MARRGPPAAQPFRLDMAPEAVATRFWRKHHRLLDAVGVDRDDVRQQAALLALERPEKVGYLWFTLIEWMRHIGHYNHRTGKHFFLTMRDPVHFQDSCPDLTQSVEMDVERVQLARKFQEMADGFGGNYAVVARKYLSGDDNRQIAKRLGCSSSNVGYLMKRLIKAFTGVIAAPLVALLVAPFLFSAQLWAQTGPCATLSWAANTESDLAGYNLTIHEDGTPRPVITFPKDATSSACEPVGSSEYVFSLTAFDESGNESAPANKPLDKKAPGQPGGMTITVTINLP